MEEDGVPLGSGDAAIIIEIELEPGERHVVEGHGARRCCRFRCTLLILT